MSSKGYAAAHREKGLCIQCPKPVAIKGNGKPAIRCEAHLADGRARHREYVARLTQSTQKSRSARLFDS